MRRWAQIAATAVLLALPTVVGFARGGYFDGARLKAGIAACLLAAIAAAVAPLPRRRFALFALAGLTAWTALSITWAPLKGPATDDLERDVLYLATLTAAATLLNTKWTEPALLAGITITAAYGLSERLLPTVIELERSAAAMDRLAQPLTYWNGQGALAAVGLVLAAGLATKHRAAAAVMPLLGLDLYLTLSRGAIGALVAGLLVLVALAPARETIAAAAIALLTSAIAAGLAETAFTGVTHAQSTSGAGAGMLVTLILLGAAAAFVPLPRGELRIARPAAIAALVGCLAVTLVAIRGGNPTSSSGRLVSAQSNRYDYWGVALNTFADHPLKGLGSGSFRVEWLQHRDTDESVRDAHSLYLETLAELGIVGFALLVAFYVGVIDAARRAKLPIAAAALAAWAVHAGVDWDWELPGLTLVAVLLAGRLIAAADAPADTS